jgi:hypothetical protein
MLSPLLYLLLSPTAISQIAIALSRSSPFLYRRILLFLFLRLLRSYYFSSPDTVISRGIGVDALTPVLGVDNDDGGFHYYETRERYCRHNTNLTNNS